MRVAMSSVTKTRCSYGEEDDLRRGPWTLEEDTLLSRYIACHGEGHWNLLAKYSGLKRTGKSCRLRWLNYLKPDVKRGNLSPEEQLLILELHSKWGNRWSKIAQHLPGRTDNEIKNYWRTRVQKQARHLKIDANSSMFRDAIRCFWMPRLLHKIEKSSLSSSSLTLKSQDLSRPVLLNHSTHAPPHPLPLPLPPTPPPQPPPQGSLSMSEPISSLNSLEKNSSSENCTISSKCCSDSMNISQLLEISEYPISPQAFGNMDYNSFQKGYYFVDNSSYGNEEINLATMTAPEGFDNSVSNCQMEESCWVSNDMAYSLWNMDEL